VRAGVVIQMLGVAAPPKSTRIYEKEEDRY